MRLFVVSIDSKFAAVPQYIDFIEVVPLQASSIRFIAPYLFNKPLLFLIWKKFSIGIMPEVRWDGQKSKEENQNAEESKKDKQESALRSALVSGVWAGL